MEKTIEELVKTIGDHGQLLHKLQKAAAFHKAASDAHTSLAKAHQEHADFVKAKHEAMDDADANKTYFGKCATLHAAKAAHHTGLAELHKAAQADLGDAAAKPAVKAVAGEPIEGGGISNMIEKTTNALVVKALESLDKDPKVAEAIQKVVLERVNAALGDKVKPDGVKGALPSRPQLVARPGEKAPAIDKTGIDPEFQHLAEA